MKTKRMLTDDDVAERLGVTVITLERWMKAGTFPEPSARSNGRGRRRLWAVSVVREWVKSRRNYTTVEQGPFPGSFLCTPHEIGKAYLDYSDVAAGIAVPHVRLHTHNDPGWEDAVTVETAAPNGTHVIALGAPGWKPKLPDGSWAPLPPINKVQGFKFPLKPKAGGP